MRISICLAALLSFVSATALAAQRTWIVDAAGGNGVDFTDLPPAVAAAAAGDRIVINAAQAGYAGATVTRGIQIVGGAGVRLSSSLQVRGIPSGQSCTIAQLSLPDSYLLVLDCIGPVALVRLGPANQWCALSIASSRAVSIDACEFRCAVSPALHANVSRVHATASHFLGLDLTTANANAAPGAALLRCEASFSACVVSGGRIFQPMLSLAPAMVTQDSSLVATGGSVLVGAGAQALVDDPGRVSRLLLDPATQVQGIIDPVTRVERVQVPALFRSAFPFPTIECRAQQGDFVATFVGLATRPVVGIQGELWLDPSQAVLFDFGTIGPSGVRSVLLGWASWAHLRGIPFTFQALVLRSSALLVSLPWITTP